LGVRGDAQRRRKRQCQWPDHVLSSSDKAHHKSLPRGVRKITTAALCFDFDLGYDSAS
jgi:hypothetical protein